jgi:Fur family transcriptional regulator, ferric uptake regulator
MTNTTRRPPRGGTPTSHQPQRRLTARAFGDGHTRFEPESAVHHDHLVCTKCSQVVEFSEAEIERLQDEVARNAGFEISSHKLELYGSCKRCRTAGAH